MDLRKWIFQVKAFAWYMVTEPFRSIVTILKMSKHRLEFFTKQSSWLIIYLGFLIFFFFTNNNKMKWAFLALLLIAILKYEWERGMYLHRYREKYKERLKQAYGKHIPTDEELIAEFEKEKGERPFSSDESPPMRDTSSLDGPPLKKEDMDKK